MNLPPPSKSSPSRALARAVAIVGAGIAWMNVTAAKAVWQAARAEHAAAQP